MKTATIRVNHIFGTKNEFCADVFYHGKLLYTFDGIDPNALAKKARAWAHARGFTHTKCLLR